LQLPSAAIVLTVLPLELSVLGDVAGVVEPESEEGEEEADEDSEATMVAWPSDPVHVVPAATAPIGIHCPQLHIENPCPTLVHLSVPIALDPQAP